MEPLARTWQRRMVALGVPVVRTHLGPPWLDFEVDATPLEVLQGFTFLRAWVRADSITPCLREDRDADIALRTRDRAAAPL